jgi:hypothetical protein
MKKTINVKFSKCGDLTAQYSSAMLSVINIRLTPEFPASVVFTIGVDKEFDRTEEALELDLKYRHELVRASLAMFEYALNEVLQGRKTRIIIWDSDGHNNAKKRVEAIKLVLPELKFFTDDYYGTVANFRLTKPVKPRFSKNFDFKVVTND